jgi:TRAP-type transport system periplasmic protein
MKKNAVSMVIFATLLAVAAMWVLPSTSHAVRELKISHQFAESDARHELAKIFAQKVEETTKGEIKFTLYPSSSLYKATPQFEAMKKGALDFSIFPLAYASGKVPLLDVTLMPCVISSVKEGMGWRNREIGKRVESICEDSGMKILIWLWYGGGIGSMGKPIIVPDDVKGFKMRAAGKQFEHMLNAVGSSITSMPSSEIYTAMQTRVLDACLTSSTSFTSYRLYEQIEYFNSPENFAIWYMAEPLVVGMTTWKSLTKEQQDTILKVAASLEAKALKDSEDSDKVVVEKMKQAGVKVHAMTKEEFQKWEALAKETSWKKFSEDVKGGKELLDLAKQH